MGKHKKASTAAADIGANFGWVQRIAHRLAPGGPGGDAPAIGPMSSNLTAKGEAVGIDWRGADTV